MSEEDNLFEGTEVDNTAGVDTSVKDVVDDGRPDMSDPGWTDWVMGLFEDDEVVDAGGKSCPRAAGLRRVARIVLEPIWGRLVRSVPVQSRSIGDLGSMSAWELTFENGFVFGDVADCTQYNTNDEFLVYSTATAATRAEARAYRKALGLNRVAAEEMTDKNTADTAREAQRVAQYESTTTGDAPSGSKATGGTVEYTNKQIGFLKSLCRELDLNVDGALTLVGVNNKSELNKENASALLDKLVALRESPGDVPDNIKGFEEWSI